MKKLALVSLLLLTGCQARLGLPSLVTGGSGSSGTPSASSGSSEHGEAKKPQGGFTAECGKYTADQKAQARTQFQTAPKEFSEDLDQFGKYEDAYANGLSGSAEYQKKLLGWWPKDVARVKSAPAKYGAYMCAMRDDQGYASMMERRWLDAKEAAAKFEVALATAGKQAPAALAADLSKAESLMQEAKQKGDGHDKNGRSLLGDSSSEVRIVMEHAQLEVLVIETTQGKESPAAKKAHDDYAETDAKLVSVNGEIADMIVAKAEVPKDGYAGGDKASLKSAVRAHWAKEYPSDKILAVYLVSHEWERKSGAQYIEATSSVQSYDNSWLEGAVVTKLDDKTAEVWRVDLRKDHIDGGKLKMDYVFRDARVKTKVLAAKVK